MGFLKKIGKTLGKLPGSKLLTKPINKLAGKTPGLKKMPAAFGMGGPKKPAGIAPSPGVVNAGVANSAPTMMQGGLPQANAAPPMQNMPPMQAPEPVAMPIQPEVMAPQGPPMEGPVPQLPPQMNPAMQNLKQRMMGGNTGITGGRFGRPSGIGPRFMGQ